jgi:ADP-ribose pyrophosphatase YjhB (NUDIX family)
MSGRVHQIAAGLIRRGDEVLLVCEQGPHETRSAWALPGGVVEPGELLDEALVREVREETGLAVAEIGPLLYLTDHDNPGYGLGFDGAPDGPGFHAIAAIFAVSRWDGELGSADPDGLILDVAFFPLALALARLKDLPYRVMREPILAYLRGEAPAGTVWCYRRQPDGEDALVARMDGAGGHDSEHREGRAS